MPVQGPPHPVAGLARRVLSVCNCRTSYCEHCGQRSLDAGENKTYSAARESRGSMAKIPRLQALLFLSTGFSQYARPASYSSRDVQDGFTANAAFDTDGSAGICSARSQLQPSRVVPCPLKRRKYAAKRLSPTPLQKEVFIRSIDHCLHALSLSFGPEMRVFRGTRRCLCLPSLHVGCMLAICSAPSAAGSLGISKDITPLAV
ncbi:hypothetical protein PENSPDRAFT_252568 [Peniophora sp. CONT]|nr:hypothetical protein PENSPDRAFT_252568 [Peniophora sp. CONT]